MGNLLQSCFTNHLVAGLTALTFTTVSLTPPPLMAIGVNIDIGAINFGIKVEKIFEKIKKCIDK
jgi:hypothetical protein